MRENAWKSAGIAGACRKHPHRERQRERERDRERERKERDIDRDRETMYVCGVHILRMFTTHEPIMGAPPANVEADGAAGVGQPKHRRLCKSVCMHACVCVCVCVCVYAFVCVYI